MPPSTLIFPTASWDSPPHFYMPDLPLTQKATAEKCLIAAREEGVKNVRIGNIHLLR